MTSPKPRFEFSKLAFAGAALLTLGVTVYACVLMWRTGDTSALAYLIPAAYAELATATAFYYSKARDENKIKLKQQYGQLAGNEGEDET